MIERTNNDINSNVGDQNMPTENRERSIDITSPVSGIDEASNSSNYITNSIDRRTSSTSGTSGTYQNLLDVDYEEDVENLDKEYENVSEHEESVYHSAVDEPNEQDDNENAQEGETVVKLHETSEVNEESSTEVNEESTSEVNEESKTTSKIIDKVPEKEEEEEEQEEEEEEQEEEEEEKEQEEQEEEESEQQHQPEEEEEQNKEYATKDFQVSAIKFPINSEADLSTPANGNNHTNEVSSIGSDTAEGTQEFWTNQSNTHSFEHIPVVLNLFDTEFLLFPINQEKCKIDCSHLVSLYDNFQSQHITIELFFQFLRNNEDLSEIYKITNDDEIVLEIPELDGLEISEDNVYCKDLTIYDFIELFVRLHEGKDEGKIPEVLNFDLRRKPRFISKYNHLVEISRGRAISQKRASEDVEEEPEIKRKKLI